MRGHIHGYNILYGVLRAEFGVAVGKYAIIQPNAIVRADPPYCIPMCVEVVSPDVRPSVLQIHTHCILTGVDSSSIPPPPAAPRILLILGTRVSLGLGIHFVWVLLAEAYIRWSSP